MKGEKPILLIEDDKVDVLTVRRALREANVTNTLYVASNGEEALTFLREHPHERPGIILLDLNMPRMNGIEFLGAIKADNQLKTIPVVVLTTSNEDRDRFQAFQYSAAGYMVKPVEYGKFVEMMKIIHGYWTISELPE